MDATTSSTSTSLNVLVLSVDFTLARRIQQFLQTLQATNPSIQFKIYPGVDKEKTLEFLQKHEFYCILVDEDYVDTGPPEWMISFQKDIENTANKDSPILFMSSQAKIEHIKQLAEIGFKDILIKPLDQSLFLQKISLANPKNQMNMDDQLFTMEAKQQIDLGFAFKTTNISEFGITIQTNRELDKLSVVTVYTSFTNEPIAARVLSSKNVGDNNFQVFLVFLGLSPAETQSLRKWIKQEYAQTKAAGAS